MKKQIAVVVGSKNDVEVIQEGLTLLDELGIGYDMQVISAHRHPEKLRSYCMSMEKKGICVAIGCAGMAAALPGFIASYARIPVIGVALTGGMLQGLDALMAMTSIPKGMGLCSTGIGKSAFINAIILAVEILALKDASYRRALSIVLKRFR